MWFSFYTWFIFWISINKIKKKCSIKIKWFRKFCLKIINNLLFISDIHVQNFLYFCVYYILFYMIFIYVTFSETNFIRSYLYWIQSSYNKSNKDTETSEFQHHILFLFQNLFFFFICKFYYILFNLIQNILIIHGSSLLKLKSIGKFHSIIKQIIHEYYSYFEKF